MIKSDSYTKTPSTPLQKKANMNTMTMQFDNQAISYSRNLHTSTLNATRIKCTPSTPCA